MKGSACFWAEPLRHSWYGCGIVVFICRMDHWAVWFFQPHISLNQASCCAQIPVKERMPMQTLSVLLMETGKAFTILSSLIHVFVCSHMNAMFLAIQTWFVCFDGSKHTKAHRMQPYNFSCQTLCLEDSKTFWKDISKEAGSEKLQCTTHTHIHKCDILTPLSWIALTSQSQVPFLSIGLPMGNLPIQPAFHATHSHTSLYTCIPLLP